MSKKENSLKHQHKYKRILLSKRTGRYVYKCQIPGCSRFLSRELAVGEISTCWRCGGKLVLTMENTSLVKPTCLSCRGKLESVKLDGEEYKMPIEKTSEDKVVDESIEEFMKGFGIG